MFLSPRYTLSLSLSLSHTHTHTHIHTHNHDRHVSGLIGLFALSLSLSLSLSRSLCLLQKVESRMGCPDWLKAMQSSATKTSVDLLSWARQSRGNEQADRLAGTADITSGLQLGRVEVLRGLRNFLNMDRPEHHSTDRLKERGVDIESGRHFTLQGRKRSVFNQTNIGTVSRATLGRLLRDGAECIWAFSSTTMPS